MHFRPCSTWWHGQARRRTPDKEGRGTALSWAIQWVCRVPKILIIMEVNWCFTPTQPVRLYQGDPDNHDTIIFYSAWKSFMRMQHAHGAGQLPITRAALTNQNTTINIHLQTERHERVAAMLGPQAKAHECIYRYRYNTATERAKGW